MDFFSHPYMYFYIIFISRHFLILQNLLKENLKKNYEILDICPNRRQGILEIYLSKKIVWTTIFLVDRSDMDMDIHTKESMKNPIFGIGMNILAMVCKSFLSNSRLSLKTKSWLCFTPVTRTTRRRTRTTPHQNLSEEGVLEG